MKTSYYLLLAAVLITLTGMVATDVLLKQEYEKIDWTNKYQFFARRTLPAARHVVIDGMLDREILIEKHAIGQALISPDDSLLYNSRMQDDTLYIQFRSPKPGQMQAGKFSGASLGLVLRFPSLATLRLTNSFVTMSKLTVSDLAVSLRNSEIRANQLGIANRLLLAEERGSVVSLNEGQVSGLQLTVQDSSRICINDTRIDTFTPTLSGRAEVQLSGQANRWVTRNP